MVNLIALIKQHQTNANISSCFYKIATSYFIEMYREPLKVKSVIICVAKHPFNPRSKNFKLKNHDTTKPKKNNKLLELVPRQ